MIRHSQRIWPARPGQIFKTWMIQDTKILRPDLSSSQPPRNSIETCTRSYYLACIKPPLNPSKKGKNGSEIRRRNQTVDQTNVEKRGNQPTHPRVTRRKSSRITVKPWLVFPKLRSISTRQIRHPASTVDTTATIP
jgi:hypothetical protein